MLQMAEESTSGCSVSNSNTDILNFMATLKGQMDKMVEDNKLLHNKIEDLRTSPLEPTEENSEETDMIGFEKSDSEEEMAEDVDDTDLAFQTRVKCDKVGPKIDDQLAKNVNDSLLKISNSAELVTLHDENPVPGNITALKVPELNPEIKIPAISTKAQAEGEMIFLQKDICTAMGMCASLLSDMGKKSYKFDRHQVFRKINDITSILAAAHKSTTFVRKLNVKSLLKEELQVLCTKKGTKERESNNLVFGDDMGKQAEEMRKHRNVVMKGDPKSKNGAWAFKRGRMNQKGKFQKGYYKKNQKNQGPKDRDSGEKKQKFKRQ